MPVIQAPPPSSFLASLEQRAQTAEERRVDDVLLEAEDHMALALWDEAAEALESLPDEVKNLTYVGVVYLDLLIGQQLWHKGLMHAFGLLESSPKNPELWLRIARLMTGAGNADGAHTAAQQCLALDPECAGFLAREGLLG